MDRIADLEEGQLIDLTVYEDINFFNFLHPEFKNAYLKKETSDLYSVVLHFIQYDICTIFICWLIVNEQQLVPK
jgi:hypothetical protein